MEGEGRKDGHLEVITERKGAIPEEGCTPFTVSRVRGADSDVEHLHVRRKNNSEPHLLLHLAYFIECLDASHGKEFPR